MRSGDLGVGRASKNDRRRDAAPLFNINSPTYVRTTYVRNNIMYIQYVRTYIRLAQPPRPRARRAVWPKNWRCQR